MKKIVLMAVACLTLASCGMGTKNESSAQATEVGVPARDCVEVLYFHGKQRCATCIAIEKNVSEAVSKEFAEEIKKGDVVFRVIDITKEENEAIAEKYEVTWSSLFVVGHKDGKESVENMTDFAFKNARQSPEEFKSGVVVTVREMLK
ncbi:nitrophenyl compound nitroreductase subunit ArsF family protein [uncultured Bacteroides sp.]|uniref:nitrophenyl compound nitroreductase subunit ArsF family protein n=1 Tax=uncultured Bacteroides sp. TaxID=162156 RepID=UPI002603A011|nr:nitrophenyl compound nitroreductase subunit ArsF family protein [uncultured Bacteroides sp.]